MGFLDMFDKFRDTIIVKEDCELEKRIEELEILKLKDPNNNIVEQQLCMARKGLKGENEIIYQLKKSNIGMFVLHDVNFVYEDLNAQVDFIVITPWCCYFIECKNLNGNIFVNEKGDFIREYSYNGRKIKKGMESPYRQVQAQRDVYKKIWANIQGKFGSFIYEKNFEKLHRVLVVVANGENILNTTYAPKELKNNIIKADALIRKLEYDRDHSEKNLWDNKVTMEKWAKYFMNLNVEKCRNEINLEEKPEFLQDNTEEDLRKALIQFRKVRAKEKNIPAYYIFTNNEMEEIIKIKPKTFEDLKNSTILSSVKIECHGAEIINIINKFHQDK